MPIQKRVTDDRCSNKSNSTNPNASAELYEMFYVHLLNLYEKRDLVLRERENLLSGRKEVIFQLITIINVILMCYS